MKASGFELLSKITKIINSTLDLHQCLNRIVESTAENLGADSCSILLLDENQTHLVLKATRGLSQESVNRVQLEMGQGICGWVAQHRETVSLRNASQDPRYYYVASTREEKFKSMLATPIVYFDNCIGVLYVQTEIERGYSREEIVLLQSISDQVAIAIQNARAYEQCEYKIVELRLLNEIGRKLSSTFDLDEILNNIVISGSELTRARYSALWLVDKKRNVLQRKAEFGAPDGASQETIPLTQGQLGEVVQGRNPILLKELSQLGIHLESQIQVHKSVMLVPLILREEAIGVLCIVDKCSFVQGTFSNFDLIDLDIVTALAGHATVAMERASVYQQMELLNTQLEEKVRELLILYEISLAMQTTFDLDQLLRIILSCITVGNGFGFNRSMLFLVDEKNEELNGMMGLGPDSGEEAAQIWSRLASHTKTDSLFEWVMEHEKVIAEKKSRLNDSTRTFSVPLQPGKSVLADTVLQRKPFNVRSASDCPILCKEIRERFQSDQFATVPVIAHDEVLGVIMVDNLYNRKPIREEDVQLLTRFATHAGLAIQNASLFNKLKESNLALLQVQEQLIQSERMSALGQLSAEIAHEIKNPLVTIGGFARRLNERMEDGMPEKKYTEIIAGEVERLEKLLGEILDYSRFAKEELQETDLNRMIEELLTFFDREFQELEIEVEKHLDPLLPKAPVHPEQIKQVLGNLLYNAKEALSAVDGGKKIVLETHFLREPDPEAQIVIRDTGGGIPPEVQDDIFQPFFTTKSRGTGLGLFVCDKIMQIHRGKIRVDNRPGVGAGFILEIPLEERSLINHHLAG